MMEALPRSEVAIATGWRQRVRAARHQRLISQVDVAIDQPGGRPVGVQMIDIGVDGEMVRLLNDSEGEAVPFEGARRRGLHERTDRVLVHESQGGRDELDPAGVVDGPAGDRVRGHVECAVVSVVPTDVGVDRVGHCGHVAPAVDVPGGHDQPRDDPTGRFGAIRRSQVILLLKAGRHRIALGPGHDLATRRRCRPGGDRTAPGLPRTVGSDDDHVGLLKLR